jgi:hypothetical protein
MQSIRGVMLLVGAVLVLVGSCKFLIVLAADRPPSDAEMIDNLRRNRTDFDRLVAMIQDRGLERVDNDWTRPEDPASVGISPARIAEYRKIMVRIGIARGFMHRLPDAPIIFIGYVRGLLMKSRAKNYVWSEASSDRYDDDNIVTNLDEFWFSHDRNIEVYRKVDGNWYLHLHVD